MMKLILGITGEERKLSRYTIATERNCSYNEINVYHIVSLKKKKFTSSLMMRNLNFY